MKEISFSIMGRMEIPDDWQPYTTNMGLRGLLLPDGSIIRPEPCFYRDHDGVDDPPLSEQEELALGMQVLDYDYELEGDL